MNADGEERFLSRLVVWGLRRTPNDFQQATLNLSSRSAFICVHLRFQSEFVFSVSSVSPWCNRSASPPENINASPHAPDPVPDRFVLVSQSCGRQVAPLRLQRARQL